MSRHKDALYIHHLQEACRKIIHRLNGVSRAVFDADDEKQDGIIRQLEIIGEAAAKCPRPFAKATPSSIGVA